MLSVYMENDCKFTKLFKLSIMLELFIMLVVWCIGDVFETDSEGKWCGNSNRMSAEPDIPSACEHCFIVILCSV